MFRAALGDITPIKDAEERMRHLAHHDLLTGLPNRLLFANALIEAKALTGGRLPHFIENDDDTPEHKAANLANGDKYLRMIQDAAQGAEVGRTGNRAVPDRGVHIAGAIKI